MSEGMLTDIARRRLAALLLIAGLMIGGLAIADVGPFSDPPTPEEAVKETVTEFYDAASNGDFERYCDLLTQTARDGVRANAARLVEEAGGLNCPAILEIAKEALTETEARIREVSVSGNRARVEVSLQLADEAVQPRTVILELDPAGSWKVSDPG